MVRTCALLLAFEQYGPSGLLPVFKLLDVFLDVDGIGNIFPGLSFNLHQLHNIELKSTLVYAFIIGPGHIKRIQSLDHLLLNSRHAVRSILTRRPYIILADEMLYVDEGLEQFMPGLEDERGELELLAVDVKTGHGWGQTKSCLPGRCR